MIIHKTSFLSGMLSASVIAFGLIGPAAPIRGCIGPTRDLQPMNDCGHRGRSGDDSGMAYRIPQLF